MKGMSPTYIILRPLLIVLPWLCLGRFSLRRKTYMLFQVVLSLIIAFCWGWALRNVFTCFIGESDTKMDHKNLAVYILYMIGGVQCIITTACGVFYVPKKLYKVLEKSDLLLQDPLFTVSYDGMRKKMKISLVVLAISMVFLQPVMILLGPAVSTNVLCLQSPDRNNSILFWVNAVSFTIGGFVWIPQKFVIFLSIYIMCTLVKLYVANCNEEFKKMLNSTPTGEKIERIRKRYFEICDLTERVDDLLRPFLFMEIAGSFANICFYLHAMIYGYLNFGMLLFGMALVPIYLGCINFILIQGSCLYESTKSCLETTNRIDPTRMDSKSISILMLFIENMKSTDVGLTFLRLFIIDKSAILMVFGTLISYVIVILQLQPN